MIAEKAQVLAPDTLNSKPHKLLQWSYTLDLYFLACQLDTAGGDAKYCCAAAAYFFYGNALSWYHIYCKCYSNDTKKVQSTQECS